MATKKTPTQNLRESAKSADKKRESKGRRHRLHAQSLDNIADDFNAGPTYPTSDLIAKWFRKEADRVRGILR